MSRKSKFIATAAIAIAAFLSTSHGASASLVLNVDADTPVIQAGKGGSVVVRVLVRPDAEERPDTAPRGRAPLAVALVLDKSGSMASDRKMENAKTGAIEALEVLGERDIAALVVYDGGARTLVGPRHVAGKGFDVFRRAISGISPGGGTALYNGVELAAEELKPFVREGYAPRVVLLSDGMANVGPSSTKELASLGRALAEREMTITTIGLGLDYNEDLMTALAAESGGNSYFAKNAESLPGIFARDMEDAVELTARRVNVTLICDGEVLPARTVGRAGTRSGSSISSYIDNVYGSEKYALFEIEIPAQLVQAEKSSLKAARVKLEYVDALTGKDVVAETPLELSISKNASDVEKNRNAEVVAQTAIARNAEVRDEVVRLSDAGRAAEASSLLRKQTEYLEDVAAFAPQAASVMAAEAEELDAMASEIESEGSMSNESRKSSVNKAYMQKNQQSGQD
ncbi:MAG: VWA domain-containing protein [Synergistaceae bacterium]|jgi:Ca-activated chloride channel family protein|nr:VWA domain-containing protein [Synergistaceae bacterium]